MLENILSGIAAGAWDALTFLYGFIFSTRFIIGSVLFGSFGLIIGGCLAGGKREDLEREILKLEEDKKDNLKRYIQQVKDVMDSHEITIRDLYKKDSYISKLEKSHIELEKELEEATGKYNKLLSDLEMVKDTPQNIVTEMKEVA